MTTVVTTGDHCALLTDVCRRGGDEKTAVIVASSAAANAGRD